MCDKTLKLLEKQILDSVGSRSLAKRVGMRRRDLQALVKEHISFTAAAPDIEEGVYTCEAALRMCRPLLEALTSRDPEEGWLAYAYHWLIHQIYPEAVSVEEDPEWYAAVGIFLEILTAWLNFEKEMGCRNPAYDFAFLSKEEEADLPFHSEYAQFRRCFAKFKLYEMMRLGGEVTDFDALGHVAGVHRIAMHASRQLKKLGIPVDLGLMSGAAAGHDIGKYGCRSFEMKRIPYLHYYYGDLWFKQNEMPLTGHIAANHSTWDLELENLPVESLLLIYADFRVKSGGRDANGKEIIRYYSLKESFDVILSKLDNVDQAKENRYRRVYAKLKDFEDYMRSIGVQTNLSVPDPKKVKKTDPAILSVSASVQRLKHMAVAHNIQLMSLLSSEFSFATVLEAARSEKNWKNSRAYINVFAEYFTYMTQKQKIQTLNFLYTYLMHKEGDIRRQAAALMGKIIINFDEEYRKELPQDVEKEQFPMTGLKLWQKYMAKMLVPDRRIIEMHRRWIGFALKRVVESVLKNCKEEERKSYLYVLLSYYDPAGQDDITAFTLLDTMTVIPFSMLKDWDRERLFSYARSFSKRESVELRTAVLRFFDFYTKQYKEDGLLIPKIQEAAKEMKTESSVALRYLQASVLHQAEMTIYDRPEVISDIFLANLKTATPWIEKEINIEMLLAYVKKDAHANRLQVATHLCNLLKVSERITVRHTAGQALLRIVPLLSIEQRNEIAIELNKGLETGEYEFSKYIPQYLGRFVLHLRPSELDEFLLELKKFLVSVNDRVVCVALDTLGFILQDYQEYRQRWQEPEEIFHNRRNQIIGLILEGLANYHSSIHQEAFVVIGHLFATPLLAQEDKIEIFRHTFKKITSTVPEHEEDQLSFFNSAACLNHIYRFISDYLFDHEKFEIPEPQKVAFFPGTFDPFSLSHKGIATAMRDMGFTVYLALDEFSWSKKTQPRMIRKKIIAMSIANEENIFIFPDDFPVNIANPMDLKHLKELFPAKELYLAVGADVVQNASSYRAEKTEHSVQTLNHIIFNRPGSTCPYDEIISGKILQLTLPEELTDISSTKIRTNVDCNRDISDLIDPIAQNFIYENNLYLREPENKPILGGKDVFFETRDHWSEEELDEMATLLRSSCAYAEHAIRELRKPNVIISKLSDRRYYDHISGMVVARPLNTKELYGEFRNTRVVNYIRDNTSGKMILICGIFIFGNSDIRERNQLLLTEMIAWALENDFTYCIYSPNGFAPDPQNIELLTRQGFLPMEGADFQERPVYAVDMKQPIALMKNIATTLKAPFHENDHILDVIDRCHKRLQLAMTKLYPGNLVLSFNSSVMYNQLVNLITQANHVPSEPLKVRKLGKNMCVPFGKILRGVAVPNTVTKTLHTEKVFRPDVKAFSIVEYPNYSPLVNQIRTIHSFHRDVILVDDFLHKGHRMRELDPIFKREEVNIDRLIVGIMSGRGRDLMEIQNRNVECVYYMPNLKAWFVESSIYPFIGGDTLDRPEKMKANLLNSINMILPYVVPNFLHDASRKAIYDLSTICLENAKEIMETLEEEYQLLFERKLTLNRLSEVVISPCCPDNGPSMHYDYHMAPSTYIEEDQERLVRLEGMIR
jgi:nicotinic acid mononucleotide adenylyltransferase